MNEQKALEIIAGIDGCHWMSRRRCGELCMDGNFTATQLEAVGWWFQRHDDWPIESPHREL